MHAVQSPPPPDLLDDDPRVVIGALQDLDLGVFEYDLVRGRQRYSATCKRLWGLRPDEAATPERIEMLIHPEDRHALAIAYASLQPDGPGQFAVEHRIVRADGVELWLHVRGRTIFEGTGSARRAIRSIGTMQDVTDLRQRPANRRTSEVRHAFMMTLEDRLRPLSAPKQIKFEAARLLARGLGVERVGYAEDTGDGLSARIVNCYAEGLATLHGTVGYAGFGADVPQRFRAGRMLIRSDAERDPALTESERRAYRDIGVAATINVPLVKNGRPVALLFVHAAQARDWSAEELALVEAVAHRTWDAVERARAERLARQATRELRARSERLRLAFEATGMSPWRADLRANRFEASEGAVALHGLPMSEGAWTIERASEVIHPDDRARVYEALAHAAREGVSAQIEYRTLWPDGTVKWVANAARGELDERGRATGRVHGTVRDVSARREAAERLAASEARLQRAHLQKDRFLATLSHELRNPLAPIRTAAQLLASPQIRGDQLA